MLGRVAMQASQNLKARGGTETNFHSLFFCGVSNLISLFKGLNWSKMFQRRAPSFKKFYEGGFEPEMTRGEAALILSIRFVLTFSCVFFFTASSAPSNPSRQSASKEKIKMAHRRIMLANHPDNGGSDFLASKVNEAKEILLREAL
ncbi:Mitochondrial import inner membrane translocase subunit tim14 [Balamuthia mandrillaris]